MLRRHSHMNSIKLSIVTFAGLGSRSDLKTADILPVIRALASCGRLAEVICSSERDSGIPHVIPAVPRLVSAVMRRLGFSRAYAERAFDLLAARRIRPAAATLVHPPHYPNSIRRAQGLGNTVIGLLTEAHPLANLRLYQEECSLLGVHPRVQHPWTSYIARAVMMPEYLVALSPFVRDSYIEQGYDPSRIYVATPDIDIERFSLPLNRPKRFTAVYMAHTQVLKGLEYVLHAWEQLKLPDAELRIIGSLSSLPAELREKYMAAIDRNSSVQWRGSTSFPEYELKGASIFISPSLTEGFGRAALEAMACGVPVITTTHARGLVEEGTNGFVVPIRDADALAERIDYAYRHPEALERMGRSARQTVEQKKPFGEQVYHIFQEIMRREGKELH